MLPVDNCDSIEVVDSVILKPGRYIVAVSGGVDSMVLLDILRRQPELVIVVAHFDHGIREDSKLDRMLVEKNATLHNLQFVYETAALWSYASEATARTARYAFLRKMAKAYDATLVTAHHQDDVLETAILNMIRGTGRKGLTSLRSHNSTLRPLLHVNKSEIIEYAKVHNIEWREDVTNRQMRYLRNHIRHEILRRFTFKQKEAMRRKIGEQEKLNAAIAQDLEQLYHQYAHLETDGLYFSRYPLIVLPSTVSLEVLQYILQQQLGTTVPRPQLYRALHFVKTAKKNKYFSLNTDWQLRATLREMIVEHL
jgi:tRNA(Ile)-lysidine synthase